MYYVYFSITTGLISELWDCILILLSTCQSNELHMTRRTTVYEVLSQYTKLTWVCIPEHNLSPVQIIELHDDSTLASTYSINQTGVLCQLPEVNFSILISGTNWSSLSTSTTKKNPKAQKLNISSIRIGSIFSYKLGHIYTMLSIFYLQEMQEDRLLLFLNVSEFF